LRQVHPFDTLLPGELSRVAKSMDIHYFKPGDRIFMPGEVPGYYYILIKGAVQQTINESDVTVYREKDAFDAPALLKNSLQGTYTAIEETICFALEKSLFLDLVHTTLSFETYYLQDIKQKLDATLNKDINKELASFMVARVKESFVRTPVRVASGITVKEAATVMATERCDALLVDRDSETGIVTNTDLRDKVLLGSAPLDAAVGTIASWNIVSVGPEDFLFHAMLLMTEHGIDRVAVKQEGRVTGLLEQVDLLSALSHRSHLIHVRIQNAKSIEELIPAADDLVYLVKSLQERGVRVRHITKLLGELNAKLYRRTFELTVPEEYRKRACLFVMGSEGRREQVLRTDQDNGIILPDGMAADMAVGEAFNDALDRLGFPPCPGGIMAKNPQWHMPLKEYQDNLYRWLNPPTGESLLKLAILFDARAVAGNRELLGQLKQYLLEQISSDAGLMAHFAKGTLMFDTPLSLFSGFVTEKKSHKDELDLKKGGIFPIVHGVRSLALEKRLTMTNTIERIKALSDAGVLDRETATELIEAFNYLLTLRLERQLQTSALGQQPDNYINPARLSKLQRDALRDVFKIVSGFKKLVSHHFNLGMVG